MSVDPNTLEEFSDKSVILHLKTDEGIEELEGKVEAASVEGMAFKEKGKRDLRLVEADEIEEIALAPETPKKITQKKLKEPTLTGVRQHLVDRHGMPRSEANSMNDEKAWDLHDQIDHKDLGHRHVADDDEGEGEAGEGSGEEAAA